MARRVSVALCLLGAAGSLACTPPATHGALKLDLHNNRATVHGDLAFGETVDPAWATEQGIRCFEAEVAAQFAGHNVFFEVRNSPPDSTLKATVSGGGLDLGLYAYSIDLGEELTLPPDVSSVRDCGSSTDPLPDLADPLAAPVELRVPAEAITVILGVAGAEGVVKGEFTLDIEAIFP